MISVMLRKSVTVFQGLAYLLTDVISLMVSTIRYSRLRTRQSAAVFSRYSPASSVVVRHDR
ncbi:hypothetical protein Tsubulata_015690 [Turnera subulata]|uniref:Uncharacterized protein n=1 Tax=Turnera subulata TaxID=218843 RepID=A0A9Q0JH47_9ROSI|nr:hypothetical protein Tsubulata_015690 [Turnera subulata]